MTIPLTRDQSEAIIQEFMCIEIDPKAPGLSVRKAIKIINKFSTPPQDGYKFPVTYQDDDGAIKSSETEILTLYEYEGDIIFRTDHASLFSVALTFNILQARVIAIRLQELIRYLELQNE